MARTTSKIIFLVLPDQNYYVMMPSNAKHLCSNVGITVQGGEQQPAVVSVFEHESAAIKSPSTTRFLRTGAPVPDDGQHIMTLFAGQEEFHLYHLTDTPVPLDALARLQAVEQQNSLRSLGLVVAGGKG